METVRRHIESQVLSLTGLALGGVDFESPKGDPGLFGPDSACWKVHGDFSSMLIGGISALLLQMLHPAALGGVWDHSNFRADMLGRLRRTGQFISTTTYGSVADAEKLIARVRRIHDNVSGTLPDAFWSLAIYNKAGIVTYSTTNRDGIGQNLNLGIFNADQTHLLAEQQIDIADGLLIVESDENDVFVLIRLAPPHEAERARYEAALSKIVCGNIKVG